MNAHARPTLTWDSATDALLDAAAERSAQSFANAKSAIFARGVRRLIDKPSLVAKTVRGAERQDRAQLIITVARRPYPDKWPDEWRMVWAALHDDGFACAWAQYREGLAA